MNPKEAIAAARRTLPIWSQFPIAEREGAVRRFADLVAKRRNDFVHAISRETGKPRWESNSEVDSVIAKIAISIEAHAARRAEFSTNDSGTTSAIRYKPHGVALVLGPFNFPAHLPNGHIVPALIAGNTVVFKPSEMTPAVGELMAQCWQRCGMPPWTLNLVQGDRSVGEQLVSHPGIDAVFFTGSFAGGSAINRLLADRPGVISALELGGNNPLIVHGVSDVTAAAYGTILSAFLTAGQRCSCARRLIVPDRNEPFIARLIEMIRSIHVDMPADESGTDTEAFCGPVINDAAAERLLAAQHALVTRGGRILVEMKSLSQPSLLSPGLIDVTAVSDRADVELFGPLLQLIRVETFDDAIAEANATAYGLAAGFFGDDRSLYERFFAQSRAGIVNWNRPLTGASSRLPFGGVGNSGNGRPSAYFAADYCDHAVASMENESLTLPNKLLPGIQL